MRDFAGWLRALLMSAVLCGLTLANAGARSLSSVRSDIPQGILLTTVKDSGLSGRRVVFANSAGLPLYDLDSSRGGPCAGDCENTWKPVLAMADDRAVGLWSLIRREGRARQWAYRGQPVYTYAKDKLREEDLSAQTSRRTGEIVNIASGDGLGGKWHVVDASPGNFVMRPTSISVTENKLANGQILVNSDGSPLYTFTGSPAALAKLTADWRPVTAGLLETSVGDFGIVDRADGIRQWVYRKQPLFSFAGDVRAGDLSGQGVVKELSPAVLLEYYLPAQAAIANDQPGGRLIEAATGKSLYARDRIVWNQIRGNTRGNPLVGRGIGLKGCDARCESEWRPFLAPASARGSGNWDVLVRPDGSKQWTYKGYALYTRADEPPGVVYHNDTYEVAVNNTTTDVLPLFMGFGLYWRTAVP